MVSPSFKSEITNSFSRGRVPLNSVKLIFGTKLKVEILSRPSAHAAAEEKIRRRVRLLHYYIFILFPLSPFAHLARIFVSRPSASLFGSA